MHRDISSLHQLTISPDQKNIRIGLGNRWRNVYEFLDSKNLSTSGGRVAGIDIGDLVLGGIFINPHRVHSITELIQAV